MDLPSEDLQYDFDSRNHYYQNQNWALTMNHMDPMATGPRQNVAPIHTGMHGLSQTTMAEHPMMGDWHFQQFQQQQQQQEVEQSIPQQKHEHTFQHQQHVPQQQATNQNVHLQQQYVAHHAHSLPHQQVHPHMAYPQQHQTINASFGGVFQPIAMPAQTVSDQLSMIPVSQSALPVSLPLDQSYIAMPSSMSAMQGWADFQLELLHSQTIDLGPHTAVSPHHQQPISPTGSHLEILSQQSSSDEAGWTWVDGRNSFESSDRSSFFVEPLRTLHDRSLSNDSWSVSDHDQSHAFLSNLDMGPAQAVYSPTTPSDHSDFEAYHHHHRHSIDYGSNVNAGALVHAVPVPTSSKATSPISQGSAGSPGRKSMKKSPIVAKGTERVQKKTMQGGRDEKRVGKRKGPLKPEQRKQASEIRKLRACLRCKFLKKTCDKGEPCAGCQPSHARLWQVPCTRIDIKEIGYFLKDKKFDYERHVSLGFSVGNIKGFSDVEKILYVTHGYGHMLPVTAREVYVRDDKCLKMDWVEGLKGPAGYEVSTAKLSAGTEGISTTMLSNYLEQHIDGPNTFIKFVEDYFEGTPFLSQMLVAAYNFYVKTNSKIIKKALKLMLAYNLTLHITMVEGVPVEDPFIGKIEDKTSKFYGKTMAPVMINFQIKCAMADMWRELHKDVLEELSSLYSSVYSGDKLKNWPTIFMLASVLLAVWECMQFDCHYRVPDESAVEKFCNDMESTPVGVIVGLFSAISQKLPSILEWDTTKHHALLGSDWNVCETMSEVRGHVTQYENYLRNRPNAKFNAKDFDSLSNKFLSRLVLRDIRAN